MPPCFPHQLKQSDLDKVFTPDIIADLWFHGKANYLDKGARFGDMIHGLEMPLPLEVCFRPVESKRLVEKVAPDSMQYGEETDDVEWTEISVNVPAIFLK